MTRQRKARVIALASLVLWLVACEPGPSDSRTQSPETMSYETIEAAHTALTRQLIDQEGVTGVGIGACNGNPCLKVYVVRSDTAAVSGLADTFGGYPLEVEVSGEIHGGRGGG